MDPLCPCGRQKLIADTRIWLALVLTVTNRLRMPQLQNGLQQILQIYHAPNRTHPATPTWVEGFSDGVIPVQCHSHNDYWRRVPLYEGLAAGCVGTEADIWVGNTTDGHIDLFVGHDAKSLSPSRTLRSLYLDPLVGILTRQNSISPENPTLTAGAPGSSSASPVGVFSVAPDTSLILLLDFKTASSATWDAVVAQLDNIRAGGWLTRWTPTEGIVERPLTIVASGKAAFDAVTGNATYRDIFYDAPLIELSDANTPFNVNNSYYASASLRNAVGTIAFENLRASQKSRVATQVQRASELGLRSRYWDTPSWPVGWRNKIWTFLVEEGASVLNVDDLTAAARWDWQMCIIGGLNICNA